MFCHSAMRWDRGCFSLSPAPRGCPWTASRLESFFCTAGNLLFSGAVWFQWASVVHHWEVGKPNQLPAGSHVFQQVANKLSFSRVRLDTSSFAGWTCPPMSPTSNWETSWSRWNDGLSTAQWAAQLDIILQEKGNSDRIFSGDWGKWGICRGWLNFWHIWCGRQIHGGFPDDSK